MTLRVRLRDTLGVILLLFSARFGLISLKPFLTLPSAEGTNPRVPYPHFPIPPSSFERHLRPPPPVNIGTNLEMARDELFPLRKFSSIPDKPYLTEPFTWVRFAAFLPLFRTPESLYPRELISPFFFCRSIITSLLGHLLSLSSVPLFSHLCEEPHPNTVTLTNPPSLAIAPILSAHLACWLEARDFFTIRLFCNTSQHSLSHP